jgi:hypothetical protein
MDTQAFTVTDTPVLIASAIEGRINKVKVVRLSGSGSFYVGDSSVTTSNGFQFLSASSTQDFELVDDDLYAVSDGGTSNSIRVLTTN